MSSERLPLDQFANAFEATTELSSAALGGKVISVSDEFFAAGFHLLLVEPAPSLKGQFGPKGALYSGWESRRHNPNAFDWCIIRLGTSGHIVGFDVDTSHFNGNEAPEVSVEALFSTEDPDVNDSQWHEILAKVTLGPSSRHLFQIPQSSCVNFVKLKMYPDGGIARFRVYGHVAPVFPENEVELYDMAHVFAGGRVVFTSDQHFGVGSNLILPGRGKDMGDGWETKRSRQTGHKDWVVLKLGAPGFLEQVEIDTAHFKGNFPESCEIQAAYITGDVNWKQEDVEWTLTLPRTKLGPHRQHAFLLENVKTSAFTHVKLTIYPDGGVKRLRVIGRRAMGDNQDFTPSITHETEHTSAVHHPLGDSHQIIPVLPLTPEAFAPFGQVIQAYQDPDAAPRGTRITPANEGTATKFHKVSLLQSSYPENAGATTGLSVYRCQPCLDIDPHGVLKLKVLERHSFTNQSFIPMGSSSNEGLSEPGTTYMVVVVQNGSDDKPNLRTLRAFVSNAAQGIVYNTGIWHQPMTVLHKPMDFTCVETQIGDGSRDDCEIFQLEERISLRIPSVFL